MTKCSTMFLAIIALTACHQSTLEKIADRADKDCRAQTSCVIDLTNLIGFSWDRIYIFRYGAQKSWIEKTIGAPFPHYRELSQKILFVRGGEVVYYEDYEDQSDSREKRLISVNFRNELGRRYYDIKKTSPFVSVAITHDPKTAFYAIKPTVIQ